MKITPKAPSNAEPGNNPLLSVIWFLRGEQGLPIRFAAHRSKPPLLTIINLHMSTRPIQETQVPNLASTASRSPFPSRARVSLFIESCVVRRTFTSLCLTIFGALNLSPLLFHEPYPHGYCSPVTFSVYAAPWFRKELSIRLVQGNPNILSYLTFLAVNPPITAHVSPNLPLSTSCTCIHSAASWTSSHLLVCVVSPTPSTPFPFNP
jgi:hypothetical protein